MNKIGIIIGREYMSRVRKKSFLVLTLLMPVLMVGLMFGTVLLSSVKSDEVKNIVVLDDTNQYYPILQSSDQYHFIKGSGGFESFREKSNEDIYATLVISGNLLQNPKAVTLYSHKQVTADLERLIQTQFNDYLSDQKLASYDIPNIKEIINDSHVSIDLQTIKWDDSGNETTSSADLAKVIGMVFTFIIYFFIFAYGGMVMQGVLEEKTNRIIEVMVSSVKPFDLMMGKIIGVGLVGITQFVLWVVLGGIVYTIAGVAMIPASGMEAGTGVTMADNASLLTTMAPIMEIVGSINWFSIIICFILFFIGGYLIYASLFAAIGAMVSSQEDTQQFMTPITILIIFAFYAGIASLENPDGPLAFWTSMIPFTSPIVMMVRLPFDIHWYELLISLVVLFVSAILLVQLAAKIYRVGILMYGKKPSMKELAKWLKY